MRILRYQGFYPQIAEDVFIADGSIIIGKVQIGAKSSIWHNSVVRADVAAILIGERSNVQDSSVLHVDRNGGDLSIGNGVTIGHCCLLHACTIQDDVFIGMGSIIMDFAIVESETMIAAGSLLTKRKVVNRGELWGGRPAEFMRFLTDKELEHITISAKNYMNLSAEYISQR